MVDQMKREHKKGKHPQKALTATTIRHLVKSGKPGKFADGNGLYLWVNENGSKKWVWRTTIGGKRCELGVGGNDVSLAEARDTVEELAIKLRRGEDIRAQRKQEKITVLTFEDAARVVHELHSPTWKNPKHAAQWISTLEDYAFPVLGSLPVKEVKQEHITKVLAPIWLKKPETAKRVRQRVGSVLEWAKNKEHRSDNPISALSVKTKTLARQPKATHHAALKHAEVPKFIAELRAFKESAEIIKLGLEFTILTAARTGEVRYAPPREIVGNDWIIPEERMKAGNEHWVPLSPRCIEILKQAAELAGPEAKYLFPNPRTGEALSENAFLQLLDRMGKKGAFTVHGFRSSFRDWAADKTNCPMRVAEAALAHGISDKTRAAYERTNHVERRTELMETWAVHCTQSGSVVPFSRRRKR